MVLDVLPEIIRILIVTTVMSQIVMRAAVHKTNTVSIYASVHMPVVSDVLGDCLLKKRSPESAIRADLCKQKLIEICEGQVIVNVSRIRNTKDVDVYSINSGFTPPRIMKDVMDSFRVLCECTEGDHHPAVSNAALCNIVWYDS